MNKTLLFFLLLLISPRAFASHLLGADLRYEYNGTNYTIILTMSSDCAGVSVPPTETVSIKSVSTSTNLLQTLAMVSQSVTPACPTTLTKCQNPSSIVPGFRETVYKANVTLPAANDWVIAYSANARSGAIINLANASSLNIYVEAHLDNSVAINSNPLVSGHTAYTGIVNSPLVIPLQAADYEGDNIVYDLITPMTSATTSAAWNFGFSLTNILGATGVCSVNNTNKTLTMQAANVGTFSIALRVREYRNNVLIASHIKDFIYLSLSGTGTITVPAPPANMTVYTCPGQSHNITVTYTDATTDSVFVDVDTPSLPGWGFTASYSSALGSGSANMVWTTPSTMNPATLPYILVPMTVRDNACPRTEMTYYFIMRTQQCASDSVWPGDANGDYTVNMYDPLAIAIAMGQTGAARTSPTTTWVAQHCLPWANSFITNNVNMKHADCDGNGTVATADLTSVTTNYGLVHPKGEFHNKVTGAPPFYFDLNGITLKPGTAVSIPIKLGDLATPMTDIYGLATRISVTGINMSSPSVATSTSWLGNSGNTLNFTKALSGKVEWAYSRTNHTEVSGNGTIATLNFTVPANATPGATVTFTFGSTKMINKDGVDITAFDEQDATATIPVGIHDVTQTSLYSIIPNPSQSHASLRISLLQPSSLEVQVTDLAGKLLWKHTGRFDAGTNSIALPATLSSGVYMIGVKSESDRLMQLKWIKQ